MFLFEGIRLGWHLENTLGAINSICALYSDLLVYIFSFLQLLLASHIVLLDSLTVEGLTPALRLSHNALGSHGCVMVNVIVKMNQTS